MPHRIHSPAAESKNCPTIRARRKTSIDEEGKPPVRPQTGPALTPGNGQSCPLLRPSQRQGINHSSAFFQTQRPFL